MKAFLLVTGWRIFVSLYYAFFIALAAIVFIGLPLVLYFVTDKGFTYFMLAVCPLAISATIGFIFYD